MDCRPDQPLTAYRIADGRHPLFDGTGAALFGARWNSPGKPVIYAASTYSGALVEILVLPSSFPPV
jgi:RES domain-containing protein